MQDNVGSKPSDNSIFGEDGKLSSKSAATSLKYARAQDLPSFPSTGGVQLSSAGAAASLANSNKKSFEHWKPEPIPAANKAALLAKDHKMDPLWQPSASEAGSKAALMAHANPIEVAPMQSKKATKSAAPSAAYDTPEDSHRKALMAAAGATANHNRRRSGSLPTQPAAKSSADAAWALKAATKSHKDGPPAVSQPFASGDPGFEAARIQNMAKSNVNRQLYTYAPPVDLEVQEKNRQATLKASAVAMAQQMYAIQQKHIDEAAGKSASDGQALAASRVRSSTIAGSSVSPGDIHPTPGAGYEGLEEAARKLAQERLAKIHDEHAEYRNYYGAQTSPNRNRLSMRLNRRRASSAATDDSDEEQSRRIKSQMSIFQSKLAEVDHKKRQSDRDALIQIAHRNVDSQISKMDDKVFQDTGKASPAQMEMWEKAARQKAQLDSDARMQHHGKVHIGGGKYLDQSELDAIARARLQPTLDDISAKAEAHRAKDEEERLERERKAEAARAEKVKAAETAAALKAISEKNKADARARKDEEKQLQREKDNAERTKRDEERRLLKEEQHTEKERARLEREDKRKSAGAKPGLFSGLLGRGGAATETSAGAGAGTAAIASVPKEQTSSLDQPRTSTQVDIEGETFHDQVTSPTDATPVITSIEDTTTSGVAGVTADPTVSPKSTDGRKSLDARRSTDDEALAESKSPSSSRVKSWMKIRFRSKSEAKRDGAENETMPAVVDTETKPTVTKDTSVVGVPQTDSMHDVAMAGRTSTNESSDMYGSADRERDVSPPGPSAYNAVTQTEGRERSPSISAPSSTYSAEVKPTQAQNVHPGTAEPANTVVDSETETRGRSGLKQRLLNVIMPSKKEERPGGSEPVRKVTSNTTDDEFEEARDTFEEERLEPPPPLTQGKTQSPKGSKERSKFTEEL